MDICEIIAENLNWTPKKVYTGNNIPSKVKNTNKSIKQCSKCVSRKENIQEFNANYRHSWDSGSFTNKVFTREEIKTHLRINFVFL